MSEYEELIEAGQYLLRNKLAWGTSGNISKRINDDKMLITASGTSLGKLTESDFVIFDLKNQKNLSKRKASKETPMHVGIYVNRLDAEAIIHSSPFYATVFACCDEPILSQAFVESMYYLENIGYVEYFHPGSIGLGNAISEEARRSDVIMMKNHGVVVFDTSVSEALIRLETLEMACKMIITAKSSGIKLNLLPKDVVKEFLEESGYRQTRKKIIAEKQGGNL